LAGKEDEMRKIALGKWRNPFFERVLSMSMSLNVHERKHGLRGLICYTRKKLIRKHLNYPVMKIILKSLFSIGMLISLHGAAQIMPADRDLAAFSWELSSPANNDYISKTSLSGWRFEYRKGIKHNLSIGIGLSWSAFDEYINTKTYSNSGQTKAITTDMIRQVYTLPITLTGHYYLNTKSKIMQPFAGLGLGTQYAEHKAYLNIYELIETNWGFTARPELGALFAFSSHSPMRGLLSFGYNYATNDNKAFNVNNWSHFTINIGIGFGNIQ
jgi:outer membrane protein W